MIEDRQLLLASLDDTNFTMNLPYQVGNVHSVNSSGARGLLFLCFHFVPVAQQPPVGHGLLIIEA
jgi:hypothetical protein